MSEAVGTSNGKLNEEVTIIFTGAAHHYVTPKFYTETKPATGKVVPTWNYSAVQAYGTATIYWDSTDASTGEYLQKQISDLSRHAESSIMGYEKPWGVDDAPGKFIDLLKKNITGVEVDITRLEGKWKMSQELKDGDREGVVEGFGALNSELGQEIANTVGESPRLKEEPKGKVA